MGHRDDYNPGDLSVRLYFARGIGNGPSSGKIFPHLEITDQVSGAALQIDLTPEQVAEMLAGGEANVTADSVSGYQGIKHWGRYQKIIQRSVPVQFGDWDVDDPASLPHLASVIAEMEVDGGWTVDKPRRNDSGQWILFGRRWDEQPDRGDHGVNCPAAYGSGKCTHTHDCK